MGLECQIEWNFWKIELETESIYGGRYKMSTSSMIQKLSCLRIHFAC